jgi:hypothetical protein
VNIRKDTRTRAAKVGLIGLLLLDISISTTAVLAAQPAASKMTGVQLARLLDHQALRSATHSEDYKPDYRCTKDINGGWDYVCAYRDQRGLYNVSATRITAAAVLAR